MPDFKKDLRNLKDRFSARKEEQIRAQTRLDGSKQRRQEAVEKIKSEGLEVKALPKEISSVEGKLSEVLDEIRTRLDGKEEEEFDFE